MIKLVDIYKKQLPEFNYEDYRDYDEYHYRHDIDGALIDDEISNVKVVQRDEASSINDWQDSIVFEYEGNFYYCECSEGSHGYGYKLNEYSLKQVFPKTKEVTYYEQ